MNGNGNDPTWAGFGYNDPGLQVMDDPAAVEMDLSQFLNEADLAGTTFELPSAATIDQIAQDNGPDILRYSFNDETNDKKLVIAGVSGQNQNVKGEILEDIQRENKNLQDDSFGFRIERSPKPKNKPYEVEDNILFTKPSEAIKIRVLGATTGHLVKMFMRFKNPTYCQYPVRACMNHKEPTKSNPDATFHVVHKIPVRYVLEESHPTAVVVMTPEEDFCFFPIFRCWNSCIKTCGKGQEMVLSVCDMMTEEELFKTTFDVRVCENVGRDLRQYREERDGKRVKKNTPKKSRVQVKNEEEACEDLAEDVLPSPIPRYFMVRMDDHKYVAALKALSDAAGKWVEMDPCERYFH